MTRPAHYLSILCIALVASLAGTVILFAHEGEQPARDVQELAALAAQEQEPETVSIQLNTYGLSVAPKGQASLLTLRIAGPGRTLLLDERTPGDPIDWSLPGDAPDGSYRYEAFVSTTLEGPAQSSVTPGGFEVKHGQIVRP